MKLLKNIFLSKKYAKEEVVIFDFLQKNMLFENLNYQELSLFLPHLYTRTYQKNEVVFFRNDPSKALYIVLTGEVALSLDVQDNFEIFTCLQATETLGSSALLTDTQRAYNAIVQTDTAQIYAIPQVNIFDIFRHNPIIKAKMLEALAYIYHYNTHLMLNNYRRTQGFFDIKDMYREWKHGE